MTNYLIGYLAMSYLLSFVLLTGFTIALWLEGEETTKQKIWHSFLGVLGIVLAPITIIVSIVWLIFQFYRSR